jgi:hypothetical protein
MDRNSAFVELALAELEAILVEWDERFANVDLDADEIALEQADQLLDAYDRKVLMLQRDPRYFAVCAAQVGLAAG